MRYGLSGRPSSPYRAGPWPGLTPRGAAVLLGCALLLVCEDLLFGHPRRAMPDLPALSLLALVPPVLATRTVQMPGAASAVCGVYLLWGSVRTLVEPSVEPPPLLLPPAVAFDLIAWLRAADLLALGARPRDASSRLPRRRVTRPLTTRRTSLAGAAFGLVLALVEPPFALLLGSDPSGWQMGDVALGGGLALVGGACLGAGLRAITDRFAA